jgi:dihydrodipicolinate reductase
MINVAVSGAMGRLGRAISSGVAAAQDMRLTGLYAPGREGESFVDGALLAIRHVENTNGVSIGLDALLGIR